MTEITADLIAKASLDKRLSLLEQSVTNGFTQLRLDLRGVLDEMVRRDTDRQHDIEALKAKDEKLETALMAMCTEVTLLKQQMSMISKISMAALLTVIGLIIERVIALL